MSVPTRLEGDTYVNGNLNCKTLTIPAGSVSNASIASGAGVDHTKLQHQHRLNYGQNGTAAAETRVLHVVRGATATLLDIRAGCVVACVGDSTITIDVKKNGTTVLSSTIQVDSGDAAYAKVAGTISGASLVAGDVLTVVVTVSAGTGTLGTGLFVTGTLAEDAS